MGQIIDFKPSVRKSRRNDQVIKKLVDGEIVECINIDALTPDRQAAYLAHQESE